MCTVVHRTCCPTHTTTALARSHPYSTVITPSDSEPRPALTQKAQRTRARGTARGQPGARTAPDMCAPTTPAIRRPYAIERTPPRRPPDRPTVSCPGPGHEIERAPELRRSLARTCGRAPSARESPAGKPPRFAWGLLFASFRHAITYRAPPPSPTLPPRPRTTCTSAAHVVRTSSGPATSGLRGSYAAVTGHARRTLLGVSDSIHDSSLACRCTASPIRDMVARAPRATPCPSFAWAGRGGARR